jgi:hypothetical protein
LGGGSELRLRLSVENGGLMEPRTLTIAQKLRLRSEPVLETPATVVVPAGSTLEVLTVQPPGWMQIRARGGDQPLVGWCMRQMLDAARHATTHVFKAAEDRMWALVRQYTGRTGYQRGTKSSGLQTDSAVIDCSGWVGLLLTEAMKAQNGSAGANVFDPADIAACNAWSDRIILAIEARTPLLLEGPDITVASLPRNATIGVNEGYFSWQENYPRLRGINHIVQVLRRAPDDAAFVSESHPSGKGGVRLTPLTEWINANAPHIQGGRAWAVDPFAMAATAIASQGFTREAARR